MEVPTAGKPSGWQLFPGLKGDVLINTADILYVEEVDRPDLESKGVCSALHLRGDPDGWIALRLSPVEVLYRIQQPETRVGRQDSADDQ